MYVCMYICMWIYIYIYYFPVHSQLIWMLETHFDLLPRRMSGAVFPHRNIYRDALQRTVWNIRPSHVVQCGNHLFLVFFITTCLANSPPETVSCKTTQDIFRFSKTRTFIIFCSIPPAGGYCSELVQTIPHSYTLFLQMHFNIILSSEKSDFFYPYPLLQWQP